MAHKHKQIHRGQIKDILSIISVFIIFVAQLIFHLMLFLFHLLQEFDGTLDSISAALTCAFNRTGSLLAVGCNDGRLVVWDFLTRGIAKVCSAHVHPVCSVRYNSNYLQNSNLPRKIKAEDLLQEIFDIVNLHHI